MKLYKIRDWNVHYEINRTRQLKEMAWVPIVCKLSGNGYTYLMTLDEGPGVFGCFVAIIEMAAKCKPRGILQHGAGKAHDSASIARMTRMPVDLVDKTLVICSSQDCDWIEVMEVDAGKAHDSAGKAHDSAENLRYIQTEQTDIYNTIPEKTLAAEAAVSCNPFKKNKNP